MHIAIHYPDDQPGKAVLSVDRWPPDAERQARRLNVPLRHELTLPADFDPAPWPALRISVPAADPPLLLLLAARHDLAQAVAAALDALAQGEPLPSSSNPDPSTSLRIVEGRRTSPSAPATPGYL